MNLKRTSFPSLQDENHRQHNLIQPMLTDMDLNGPSDPIHRILSLDNGILWLTWLFAEGKMRSLFSLLFGAGVIMIIERYEKSGKTGQAARIFYRRNFWLLLIGLCHGFLLFPGDIPF